MHWNTALASPAFMSGGPRGDVEPFLGWWSVARCASSLPWFPKRGTSPPRSFAPAIISAGATYARPCSRVRRPADASFVSAKIPRRIWRLWKLSYSCEVCYSAQKTRLSFRRKTACRAGGVVENLSGSILFESSANPPRKSQKRRGSFVEGREGEKRLGKR